MTSTFQIFKELNYYSNFEDTEKWIFEKMLFKNNKCIVHPNKCNSREDAELLRGKKIYSKKNRFPKIEKNKYYVIDLLKCTIFLSNGNLIGKVIAVENFGADDLLETNYKNKNIYIPMNNDNLISVDITNKKILVKPIKGILD